MCLNSVNPFFHVFKNLCLRLQYASKYLKFIKKDRFSCRFLVEQTYFVKNDIFKNALFQSVNWYLCDKIHQNSWIIPITTRKIKSVNMSLFVYPPKYGYFELSVFDYELLCLNVARTWTSLQFVQVRTSPTSHAATTFWSRSFVASLSTRYWQVTTLYRVLHAQLWGCPLSYHRVEHCFFSVHGSERDGKPETLR